MRVHVGQLTNHVDELDEASLEYARVVHLFPVRDDCSTMRRGGRVQTVTRGLDSYFVDQVPLGALATADTHECVAAHTCVHLSLHGNFNVSAVRGDSSAHAYVRAAAC